MAKTGGRRAVRGLAKVPSDALHRELTRRQKVASKLERMRDGLLAKLADLEGQIRKAGGSVTGSVRGHGNVGRPRGGRTTTLPEALATLLKGRTMSVTDMSEAVQKAGYQTNSPNFRTIVNAAVINHADLFRRVGRGQYTAK